MVGLVSSCKYYLKRVGAPFFSGQESTQGSNVTEG